MSTAAPLAEDSRVESILEQITQFASGHLQARGAPSGQNDELDGIITGLNMLGEELLGTTTALAKMNAALEGRVRERTRELEEANRALQAEVAERKQAEAMPQARLEELQIIYRLSEAIGRAESIEKIYDESMDSLLQAWPADRASILIFDEGGVMRFRAWRGLSETCRQAVEGHSSWTPDAQNPQPILVEDVEREPSLEHLRPAFEKEGLKALGFIPLVQQGRLLGKFMICFNTRHHFAENEIRLAQTIASHAASAIERKRAEMEKEGGRRIQEALNAILRVSNDNLTLEECLDRTLGLVLSAPFLTLEQKGAVFLVDPAEDVLLLTSSHNLPTTLRTMCAFVPFGHCLCGRAAGTRQVQYADCVDERHENVYAGIAPHGHYNIPIVAEDKVLGVIVLYLPEGRRKEQFEVDFLQAVADILSGTIKRKQAEGALRWAEERYRRLFEEAPLIYISTRNQAGMPIVTTCNQAFLEGLGYTLAEVIGQPLPNFYTPESRIALLENGGYQRALERYFAAEERALVARDGRVIHTMLTAVPEADAQGNVIGTRAMYVDITERKRAEEALREAEHKYRMLVERLPVVVYTSELGANGVWPYVSPQIERLLGFTPEEWMADPGLWYRQVHSEDVERQEALEEQAYEKGGLFEGEYRIFTRDGRQIWIRDSAQILPAQSGGAPIVQGVLTDITERKQAEAALTVANAELEQALLNARELAVAAQAANRAKSEFLANMSHEIRTPLTAVLGLTELTLSGELTAEQHACLEQVYTSGQFLLELINNILDLSKIEAARPELEKVEFELSAIIQQVTTTLSARAAAKQLDFNYSLSVDAPKVLVGDPARLRQILLNLLGNAIKFTEQGEVSLSAGVEGQTADEVTLHFAVKDTGIGIPEDKQGLIFEPFVQAEGDITRKYGGTGLGLTISHRLVEKFGGQLWVESRVGQGSTFHFNANFGLAASPAATAGVNDRPVEMSVPATTARLNILLAEDNPANQLVLRSMLEKRGWKVTVVENGKEALEKMAGPAYDLILMDLQMPGLDGLSATVAIRAQEQGTDRHVPILALTAFAMSGDRERCLQAGMDDYLAKPVKASELYSLVERLTQLTSAR